MSAEREPHGVPGQLNILTLDKDSEVTGYGQHHRIVVFGSLDYKTVTMREDCWTGPRESTDAERRKVALHDGHRIHPPSTRLEHVSSEPYDGRLGTSIEHTYNVIYPRLRATP